MVTIVDYKGYQREDGTEFFQLIIQGGVEAVRSQETGRTYLTARKARMSCTFDEATCQSLIGSKLDGSIKKVEDEPYEYTIPTTGEIITLNYRWEYVSEEESVKNEHLVEETIVM